MVVVHYGKNRAEYLGIKLRKVEPIWGDDTLDHQPVKHLHGRVQCLGSHIAPNDSLCIDALRLHVKDRGYKASQLGILDEPMAMMDIPRPHWGSSRLAPNWDTKGHKEGFELVEHSFGLKFCYV